MTHPDQTPDPDTTIYGPTFHGGQVNAGSALTLSPYGVALIGPDAPLADLTGDNLPRLAVAMPCAALMGALGPMAATVWTIVIMPVNTAGSIIEAMLATAEALGLSGPLTAARDQYRAAIRSELAGVFGPDVDV